MDVWTGAIALDKDTRLRGLRLIDRTTQWRTDILKDSTLTLCCFVNPALVPIYARTGPNLELHTADIETAEWLKNKLLGNIWLDEEELENFQTFQCPVGILLSVGSSCRAKSGSLTTELLVYGVLSSAASFERPPTPPGSSSPDVYGHDHYANKQELRIYAIPLSTSLVNKAQALDSPLETDTLANDGRLVEPLSDIRSPSPKRKRVASLFETAAQHHKKVRQKGGEAVSQLMANSLSYSTQHLQTLRIKRESEEPGLPLLERLASQRSRSLSVGAGLHPFKPCERRAEQLRPSSQRGYVREPVSRKGTPNPFSEPSSRRGPTPSLPTSDDRPETFVKSKDSETIISENKNTISRTILTCMRLYGFNRSSKSAGTAKISDGASQDITLTTDIGPASSSDEDEFKAMYHATYRASTFALRKYLKDQPDSDRGSAILTPSLEKEKAMTYIDEFLRLFCEER